MGRRIRRRMDRGYDEKGGRRWIRRMKRRWRGKRGEGAGGGEGAEGRGGEGLIKVVLG